MSESPRNRGQYGVCSPFASVNPGMAKPAGSCPCNSGSERETQPARAGYRSQTSRTGAVPTHSVRGQSGASGSRRAGYFHRGETRRRGVAELDRRSLGEFKRVLASAGVDVARLFSHYSVNRAEGGPFAPPKRADRPTGEIAADGLAGIRGFPKALTLSTPLEHYQVASRFGPRRDPFNGRAAFHTGLDFDAACMSPVYARAPRIVTYAGYQSAYGKVVEIDHGDGIATVDGHMHR